MILATGMIVFSCAEIGSPYRVLTFAWPVTLSLRDCKRARLPMRNSFWLGLRHTEHANSIRKYPWLRLAGFMHIECSICQSFPAATWLLIDVAASRRDTSSRWTGCSRVFEWPQSADLVRCLAI